MTRAYNPLDVEELARSTGNALQRQSPIPLNVDHTFEGCGIYAIYYTGPHPAYSLLTEMNRYGYLSRPIYVGKASPKGSRIGITEEGRSRALSRRIGDHAKSVNAALDLALEDFRVRYLIVEPLWIPLGESIMITWHQPVWNCVIEGFGNHDPGAGRRGGKNTRWDTLHPGRSWAAKQKPRKESAEDIANLAGVHLAKEL